MPRNRTTAAASALPHLREPYGLTAIACLPLNSAKEQINTGTLQTAFQNKTPSGFSALQSMLCVLVCVSSPCRLLDTTCAGRPLHIELCPLRQPTPRGSQGAAHPAHLQWLICWRTSALPPDTPHKIPSISFQLLPCPQSLRLLDARCQKSWCAQPCLSNFC